ncbi:Semaphorin-3D, partial [Ameca splendens]
MTTGDSASQSQNKAWALFCLLGCNYGREGRRTLVLIYPVFPFVGLILLASLPFGASIKQSVPRVKLSYRELLQAGSIYLFSGPADSLHSHSLLLDEEKGRLLLGARDHIYLLDPNNLGKDPRKIFWPAPRNRVETCKLAGKSANLECANFVRVLHNYNRTHVYACGTGGFHPTCAFIEIAGQNEDGVFQLLPNTVDSGRLKCPFDPLQPFASVLS